MRVGKMQSFVRNAAKKLTTGESTLHTRLSCHSHGRAQSCIYVGHSAVV